MPALSFGVHDEYLRAWVVFAKGQRRYPWSWFCGPMAHCWVMWSRFWPEPSLTAHESTMKAEHTPGGLYQDWSPLAPAEMLRHVALSAAVLDVLALTVRVTRNRLRYFGGGVLTCVTVVKAVLNLDAPFCLTPAQLHRRLLAMGATRALGD